MSSIGARIVPYLSAALLLLMFAAPASASSLTFTMSPNLTGLTFAIENQGLAATELVNDGVTDTYKILLTLETTTAYADADLLAAFSLDLSDSDLDGAWLASAPGDGLVWTLAPNSKVTGNAAKCTGGEAGGLCVEETASATGNLVLDANRLYEWVFHVDLGATGFSSVTSLYAGLGELEVKQGRYGFKGTQALTGTTGFLLAPGPQEPSELVPTAAVPEPGSLLLLGSGLVLAASRMRRRMQK